jgi:ArsR family transcriptional regulator
MGNTNYQDITLKIAPLFDALSHPARLQILIHLAKYRNCPAGNISKRLPISKSTVSQHMAKLREAGLITCTPDGVCQNYRLNDDGFAMVKKYFNDFSVIMDVSTENRTDCCAVNKIEKSNCSIGKAKSIKSLRQASF